MSAACSSSGRMRAAAAGDGGSVGWACPALYVGYSVRIGSFINQSIQDFHLDSQTDCLNPYQNVGRQLMSSATAQLPYMACSTARSRAAVGGWMVVNTCHYECKTRAHVITIRQTHPRLTPGEPARHGQRPDEEPLRVRQQGDDPHRHHLRVHRLVREPVAHVAREAAEL